MNCGNATRCLSGEKSMANKKKVFQGKRVLVLGANPETVSLVVKAREMGCFTVVTDYNHDAMAKRYADKALDVDASDVEALERVVRDEHIDGILLGVAEALSISYCRLCARMGMPCFATEELFALLTDKRRFKDVCRQYGVPVVPEYDVTGQNGSENVEFPVVVKPVDGCSSKGISICRNKQELDDGVQKALSFSRQKQILVERYMDKGEVVIYYVFQDGEPTFLAMCDRYTNKEQDGVAQLPTAYIFPSRFTSMYERKIDSRVGEMFRGIGIKNGVMFIQSFVDETGNVFFYEPGYRLNGAQEHIILSRVIGIDAKELLVRYALTGRVSEAVLSQVKRSFSEVACKFSPLVKEGVIAKIEGIEEIRRQPEVVAVQPSYKPGDKVEGFGTLRQIVTRIYLVADNYAKLFSAMRRIYSLLRVEDEFGQNMLLGFTDLGMLEKIYE